jgi:UDP-N-acetylmuramoyl-tripeptide--D-alanyl-D-alanine ligase
MGFATIFLIRKSQKNIYRMNNLTITLEDLFNLPGAVIYNPDSYHPVSSVTIDSRNIPSNALFIAIKGKKFDGHMFMNDVLKKGVKAIVINKSRLNKTKGFNIPIITVPDTTIALGNIACLWRKKLNTKIVAITGSAGKTSTKEILVQILEEKFNINKTVGNNNNHIGVPLTILSTNNKHEALVIELGTNHFGEIQYSAEIIQPDYSLITNIGDSHLEFFKNRDGVFQEKSTLFRITNARNGYVFINNDDVTLKKYGNKLTNKISYAFNNNADVRGNILGYNSFGQTEIEISFAKKTFSLSLPLYGEQNAKNFLAAVAIALKLGLSHKEIKSAARKLIAVDKRLNAKMHKNFMLIDDTYNANPESMKSSLNLLGRVSAYEHKVAILGDMFELGTNEVEFHKDLFPVIRKNHIDIIYTIGKRMQYLHEELKKSDINIKHFNTRSALKSFLAKHDFVNSVILVKGSRGMKMEEFVQTIEAGIL